MSLSDYAFKEIDGTYYDYLEILNQMGYVCFFSVSFPLAPLLAFINNVIEIQVDKTKLIKFKRRPIPIGAETLGIWKTIFMFTTTVGMFVSLGILMVTERAWDEKVNNDNYFTEFMIVAACWSVFKVFTMYFIPDAPKKFLKA